MVDKFLAASVTGVTSPLAVVVNQSHDSATAVANVQCISTTLDIGDPITINLGYTTGTDKVFEGYVKSKERTVPEDTYTIVAHDKLTRAVDFFIVSSNPESPFTYNNIACEDLIQEVLEMAGLTSFDFDNTYFTFGINNPVEVNLVSSYDYARMLADLIAWNVWTDRNGVTKLKNRKPYPMYGTSGQPGDVADASIITFTDDDILDVTYAFNERDLRNKVCIYGAENLYKEAKSAVSYDPATDSYRAILPSDFYKAMVLASPLIDDATFAQDACNYNLSLYNKITYECPIIVEGNGSIEARTCITVNSTKATIAGLWYCYQVEHNWSKSGYLTNILLKK